MKQKHFAALSLAAYLVAGCTSTPPPRTVHQDFRTIIQLRTDPKVGLGHSHPVNLAPEHMVRILSGIRVRTDRYAVHRLFAGEADERPAFTSEEVWSLAVPLITALRMAKPEEVATFYRRISDQTTGLAFTTGGLFLRGDELYFVLANYRQGPADAMAMGIPAYEMDPVDDPLLPLRRAGYRVSFVPEEAEVRQVDGSSTWTYVDPAKVVVINTRLVHLTPPRQ